MLYLFDVADSHEPEGWKGWKGWTEDHDHSPVAEVMFH